MRQEVGRTTAHGIQYDVSQLVRCEDNDLDFWVVAADYLCELNAVHIR